MLDSNRGNKMKKLDLVIDAINASIKKRVEKSLIKNMNIFLQNQISAYRLMRCIKSRDSQFVILAGRPRTGKTNTLIKLAIDLEKERNETCAFFTDDKKIEGFSNNSIRVFNINMPVEKMKKHVLKIQKTNPLRVVFIDCVQLIGKSKVYRSHNEHIADVVQKLNQMSKSLNITIVAAAQLHKSTINDLSTASDFREITDTSCIDRFLIFNRIETRV